MALDSSELLTQADTAARRRRQSLFGSGVTHPGPIGSQCFRTDSIATDLHALLVVARGAVVGVNDSVGGEAVGVVGLGPRGDGVHIWRRDDAQRVGKYVSEEIKYGACGMLRHQQTEVAPCMR